MNDWQVIGHDWAVRRLARSIQADQIAQSHLFTGPPSVGKATLARAFCGAALQLGARDPARARALVDANRHPDLTWLEPQEGSIKIDAARELLHSLNLAPLEGRFRAAVVADAHLLTDAGQNAILKTLEEPGLSVIIILLAPGLDGMLPTIVSRCQVLNLRPVRTADIEQALLARGVDPGRAGLAARLSRGRPGWALRAVADGDLLAARRQRLDDLLALLPATRTRRLAYAEALAKEEPDDIASALEYWQLFWRDVADAGGRGSGAGRALNADYAEAVADLAGRLPRDAAARAMRGISAALSAMQRNANARLALEVLLLQLPR
jgi:DNA polymerase-3 subunit delta'